MSAVQVDIKAANDSIQTVGQILDIFNNLDRFPWAVFKEKLSDIDKYPKDYSEESVILVGNIKANMRNIMDTYFEAMRRISEWCALAVQLLKTHVKLFTSRSALKAVDQLFQKVLSDGVAKMTTATAEIQKMSNNFGAAYGTLTVFFLKLEQNFDQDNAFSLQKLFRTDHKEMDRAKAIVDLKERLAYLQICQAAIDIIKIEQQLETQVDDLKELNVQSNRRTNFETIANDATLRDAVVNAIENLIAKCSEYVEKHDMPNAAAH